MHAQHAKLFFGSLILKRADYAYHERWLDNRLPAVDSTIYHSGRGAFWKDKDMHICHLDPSAPSYLDLLYVLTCAPGFSIVAKHICHHSGVVSLYADP